MSKQNKPSNDFKAPLLDAFGGKVNTKILLTVLSKLGLNGARLIIEDNIIRLKCLPEDINSAKSQHALSWLKSVFSPLKSFVLEEISEDEKTVASLQLFDNRKTEVKPIALEETALQTSNFDNTIKNLLVKLGLGEVKKQKMVKMFNKTAISKQLPQKELADSICKVLPFYGNFETPLIFALSFENSRLVLLNEEHQSKSYNIPCIFFYERNKNTTGCKPAYIVGLSFSKTAMETFVNSLIHQYHPPSNNMEILLEGMVWAAGRRPIISRYPANTNASSTIWVDQNLCTSCGRCSAICPTLHLDSNGMVNPETECIRCFDCVEACPEDALRPIHDDDSSMLLSTLESRKDWLKRLTGQANTSFPSSFPPSFLLPKEKRAEKPVYILGLAIMTMQEHAAVLLKDGKIVGAIEEERLVRKRHYGWTPLNREGITLAIDPTIAIEEAFCRKSIRALLSEEGITLDDIDVIALNGLPARYRKMYSISDTNTSLPIIQAGRIIAIPHHLCHAASSFRVSGEDNGWVFTVDGRGDRETAALFRATDGKLKQVFEILSLSDQSIGGVYETVTRILGFGNHGQGSVMALASFGKAKYNLSSYLSAKSMEDFKIHETGLVEEFKHLTRKFDEEITPEHHNLAKSLQAALEKLALTLLKSAGVNEGEKLCLAGGVSLNCSMNQHLKNSLKPSTMFIQPSANDAGTALGAALEAHHQLHNSASLKMEHAYLGPKFSNAEIESALKHRGLAFSTPEEFEKHLAKQIVAGKIVCWFNGKMEFGPRALGARSILADPSSNSIKDRVNELKKRQSWRPFGPSVLAGYEKKWFEDGFDSRFMLHTVNVKKDKQELIPAVMHADGTTRPQMVHAQTNPRYHKLISEFHSLTEIPMLLNTSFNRRGEPIVCTPQDAIECFLDLGADILAIGDYIVMHPSLTKQEPGTKEDYKQLAKVAGNRRLNLRLTTDCDCHCEFCTLKDIPQNAADKSFPEAQSSLVQGRLAGCNELVLMRGEVLKLDFLTKLLFDAKAMGYQFIQLQTSGRKLASRLFRQSLLNIGVNAFEIMFLSATTAIHDRLTGVEGSQRETLLAIKSLAMTDCFLMVSIPLLRDNLSSLGKTIALLNKLGVTNVQLNFPRPLDLPTQLNNRYLPKLSDISVHVKKAIQVAKHFKMQISTEAIPFCHLPEDMRIIPDAVEDWQKHRIDDLHVLHESLTEERQKARPIAPVCRACIYKQQCPKTWALYQELFGSQEFQAIKK